MREGAREWSKIEWSSVDTQAQTLLKVSLQHILRIEIEDNASVLLPRRIPLQS